MLLNTTCVLCFIPHYVKSCVVYNFASLRLESLEIDSIRVQCSNTIFATNTHIEMNAINLTLSFCVPAEVRL